MLDFLRRKERRKQPSQDNVPFSPANVVKYPAASASGPSPIVSSSSVHHAYHQQQSSSAQPLRDRNPIPGGTRPRAPSPAKPNAVNANIHAQSHGNLGASVHHHATYQNPSPSASAAQLPHQQQQQLRRANTQLHQQQTATQHQQQQPQRRPKPSATLIDKENNNGVVRPLGMGMQPDRTEHIAPEQQIQGRSRWGKRQQNQPQLQQNAKGYVIDQPSPNLQNTNSGKAAGTTATDGKKKRNRRFKNRHEPAVLTKAVSSDRRRSLKAPAPAAVPTGTVAATTTKRLNVAPITPVATGSNGGISAYPAQQQVASSTAQQQHLQQQTRRPAAAQQAAQQGTATQQHMVQAKSEVTWTSWPHLDLAGVLKRGDNNLTHADIYISRIVYMVSHEDAWRLKMIQEGAALTIASLLSHPKTTLAMRQNAAFALAELAMLEACEDALVKAGAVGLLIWFTNTTNNSDIPLLASACRALRNLFTFKEETAVLAARHSCVEPLLALLSGRTTPRVTDPVVIVEAVAAISNLVDHGHRFQSYVLVKRGGLAVLVALGCSTDNDEVLFHVVNILAECATSSRWHKLIVSEGGLRVALRALRHSRLPDVPAEGARLIGNCAVTHKARVAVRDNGGLAAIIDRMVQNCPSSTIAANAQQENNKGSHSAATSSSPLPSMFATPSLWVDLLSALANVCDDARAASETLAHKDAAATLLAIYTADRAPEVLVKASFHTLVVLAQGSATRRAKVLYAVGIHVKRAIMEGKSPKRLYDLRQTILEEVENGEKDATVAMPESLERLSRASVRMINSGVVNYNRGGGPGQVTKRGSSSTQQQQQQLAQHQAQRAVAGTGGRMSGRVHGQLSNHQGTDQMEYGVARRVAGGVSGHGPMASGRDEMAAVARKSVGGNKFRSTGRVVSVTHNRSRRRNDVSGGGIRQPEGAVNNNRGANMYNADDDASDMLPRGNEEAKGSLSDAEIRTRMLAREADGNMAQEFFEIGQVLGKGGYGSVFMAKDLRTGDYVAIKRFHNSGSLVDKKAIKEQNIWKGLHHPNVVEFRGSFVGDNGSLNLVVEYVDGLSLAEHLSQYTAFPEKLVAEISRQVLCGLAYLHRNGVTHRDLKPANILVDSNARVKICDFGVSRSDNVQTINPGQQHMVGTPWYIAPEMVEYRPYTTSVDIWSLGCTVLELATGRRPYHELSAMQVLFRMVEDRCPPIPQHISPEARDFLKACWVWDPTSRPSANHLLQHAFIRKYSDPSKQLSGNNSAPVSTDCDSG